MTRAEIDACADALARNGITDHATLAGGIEQLGRRTWRAESALDLIAIRLGCDTDEIHAALDLYGVPRLRRIA